MRILLSLGVVMAVMLVPIPGQVPAGHVVPLTVHPAIVSGWVFNYSLWVNSTQWNATGTYDQLWVANFAALAGLASNLQNIELAYPNGTPVQAWIESNASSSATSSWVWLHLYSIPANGSQRLFLYVYPTSTSFFSVFGPLGLNPVLAGAPFYGAWDNGARVFPTYDNFSGGGLKPTWVVSQPSFVWLINNGLTVYNALVACPNCFGSITTRVAYPTGSYLVDSYVNLYAPNVSEAVDNIAFGFGAYYDACQSAHTFGVAAYIGSSSKPAAEACSNSGASKTVNFGASTPNASLVWTVNATQDPKIPSVYCTGAEFAYAASLRKVACVAGGFTALEPVTIGIYATPTVDVDSTTQWIRVRAFEWGVQSVAIDTTPVTLPPANLRVTSAATTSISLSWTNPVGAVTDDVIHYGTSCGSLTSTFDLGVPSATGIVTGLAMSTTYCFAVHADYGAIQTPRSGTVTGTTASVAPPSSPPPTGNISAPTTYVTPPGPSSPPPVGHSPLWVWPGLALLGAGSYGVFRPKAITRNPAWAYLVSIGGAGVGAFLIVVGLG